MPPARGIIAASSEQQSAPVIVITPATVHASNSQPGAPVSRDDSADVMKMPEPIIEPTTIIAASSGPRRRTSCPSPRDSGFIVGNRQGRSDHDVFGLQPLAQFANELDRVRIVSVDADRRR